MTTPVVNTRPTPEQPPRKKQHRHSGIFRVANFRPGTMPRGKYPESPAQAGLLSRPHFQNAAHVRCAPCQSRAATTYPSQPFQPPFPQPLPVQPQKNPPTKMIRLLPGQHATGQARSVLQRSASCRAEFTPCVIPQIHTKNLLACPDPQRANAVLIGRPVQPAHRQPDPPKPKWSAGNTSSGFRASAERRHFVAACVSDHSRGQVLPPATALRTNDNNTPTIVIPDIISRKRNENIRNLRRKAGMTPHWRECEAPLRRTQRDGADETIRDVGGGSVFRHGCRRAGCPERRAAPVLLVVATPQIWGYHIECARVAHHNQVVATPQI